LSGPSASATGKTNHCRAATAAATAAAAAAARGRRLMPQRSVGRRPSVRSGSVSAETPATRQRPFLCRTKTTLGAAEAPFGRSVGALGGRAGPVERQTISDLC